MTRTALIALLLACSAGACATRPRPLAAPTAARLQDSRPERLAAEREARRPDSAEDERRWGVEQARARAEQQKRQKEAKTTRVDVVDPKTKAPRP
jgi:hypothetical protein